MELLEIVFDIFGNSIFLNYFRLIETYCPNGKNAAKAKLLKTIVVSFFALLFLSDLLALFFVFLSDGILKNVGVWILICSVFVFVIYILVGCCLKKWLKNKNA